MKKLITSVPILALIVAGFTACNKPASPSSGPGKPSAAVAETNSFQQVTAQLEPGGSLYLYLSTEQLTAGISDRVAKFHQVLAGLPNVKEEDRANINKVFDVVTGLVKDSGIEDVSGFGASAVMHQPGLYHNKCLLHHYQGKGAGFLWTMFGQKPHALTGLDLLSENTALAYCGDLDLPLLWSSIQKEVSLAHLPQADEVLAKLPAEFQKATGLKWEQVLGSLGGEYGFALMLDESRKVALPIPGTAAEIPEPSIMLMVRVKDDTLFNRLEQLMKQAGQELVVVDKPNLKMRTLPLALPLPIQLRPTIASSEGYLFIANTDSVIQQALAVKAGQAKGLKSTAEFQRLATDVPLEGNHFSFVSARFGENVLKLQQQVLQQAAGSDHNAGDAFRSMLGANAAGTGFCVSANTDEGWRMIGNGNQHPAKVFLAAAVVPAAILAAVAVPNFVKARQTAQKNACIQNLRRIQTAKKSWAQADNKADSDTPSREDLAKYLEPFPTCPAGGTYTINSVGERPECSVEGHRLPRQ